MSLGCKSDPGTITQNFLSDLQAQNYVKARRLISPGLKEQIAIIEQDKNALYNGQQWKYYNINSKVSDNRALISYQVRLYDGTKIDQTALLAKLNNQWQIISIKNDEISYSPGALMKRTYARHGNNLN